MRPPRRALASIGSTAGGRPSRAASQIEPPTSNPPTIGQIMIRRGEMCAAPLSRSFRSMPNSSMCVHCTARLISMTMTPAAAPTRAAMTASASSLERTAARMRPPRLLEAAGAGAAAVGASGWAWLTSRGMFRPCRPRFQRPRRRPDPPPPSTRGASYSK